MFGDALLAADGYLGLSSRVDDPGRYMYLTDTILHQIRQSTNEVSPYGLIVGLLALYIDLITHRNSPLPGHCSVGWIHTNCTHALGRGSLNPRSNSRTGTPLSLRIPFRLLPMIYPFHQEHTLGRLDPTMSSSLCTRCIATSRVMAQTSTPIQLIECCEYQRLEFSSASDGPVQILQTTTVCWYVFPSGY